MRLNKRSVVGSSCGSIQIDAELELSPVPRVLNYAVVETDSHWFGIFKRRVHVAHTVDIVQTIYHVDPQVLVVEERGGRRAWFDLKKSSIGYRHGKRRYRAGG